MDLLIATANPGKAREFREMLGAERFAFSDLASLSGVPDVAETGRTFLANACLKAAAYARHFRRWALADDSGLEVDALDGSPGVYSARWAAKHGQGHGDSDNNRLLLQQLADVTDEARSARFVCVLALADPDGRIALTTRGTVEGRILREPSGANGFGYDPLFLITAKGRTTAELPPDEKHAISHRGNALRVMRELMSTAQLLS